jgi:hypothetical protein
MNMTWVTRRRLLVLVTLALAPLAGSPMVGANGGAVPSLYRVGDPFYRVVQPLDPTTLSEQARRRDAVGADGTDARHDRVDSHRDGTGARLTRRRLRVAPPGVISTLRWPAAMATVARASDEALGARTGAPDRRGCSG